MIAETGAILTCERGRFESMNSKGRRQRPGRGSEIIADCVTQFRNERLGSCNVIEIQVPLGA